MSLGLSAIFLFVKSIFNFCADVCGVLADVACQVGDPTLSLHGFLVVLFLIYRGQFLGAILALAIFAAIELFTEENAQRLPPGNRL